MSVFTGLSDSCTEKKNVLMDARGKDGQEDVTCLTSKKG